MPLKNEWTDNLSNLWVMNPESESIPMIKEMHVSYTIDLIYMLSLAILDMAQLVFKVSFRPVLYTAFCLNFDSTYTTKSIQSWSFSIYLGNSSVLRSWANALCLGQNMRESCYLQ